MSDLLPTAADFEGGLAIWHIDETMTGNTDETRKLVDLEEANNKGLDLGLHSGLSTNLFWDTNNDNFDNDSSPDSQANDQTATNISVINISTQANTMDVNISHP